MDSSLPESPLTEQDVRKIVRLLGGVIATRGDIHATRRMLMEGLCELVGANTWVWCMAEYDPDKAPSFIGLLHGGFDDERFARYIEAMNHPAVEEIVRPHSLELQERGSHLTRTLRQMDPEMKLENSPAGPCWEKAGIGGFLVSQRPMEGGGLSCIGVYRDSGLPHFDERESRIAHIILSEVPWLHFQAFPDQASKEINRLYPRHRTVLNFLGEGWSRKKIAGHMGISLNTVHGYAKVIFRHFGVHSQSELISRLTKGDGGDTPHLGNSIST